MKFMLKNICLILLTPILLFCQTSESKIIPDDGEAGDNFGIAVDIDDERMVVGAYWDDDFGSNAGAVYVYTRMGSDWFFQQKITAEDASAGAYFGNCVAIDGAFLVAGAPRDDAIDEGSGSAYVFQYDSLLQTWSQIEKLIPPGDTTRYDEFGSSVAVAGSYIAVGAIGDDNYAGTVYLYQWQDSVWLMRSQLTAQDPAANASFGFSLVLEPDRLLAGAPFSSDGGAVYYFERTDSSWIQHSKLGITGEAQNPVFGYDISLLQDYALIGAIADESDGTASGAAYVFQRAGDEWLQQQKLTDAAGFAGEEFGFSVALSQDFAIVGARQDDDNGGSSGSVFVFSRQGDEWHEQTKLVPDDGGAGDMFGYSLAMDNEQVVVGAPGNSGIGAVYGFTDWIAVGFDQRKTILPHRFMLSQNYPNPFNNATMINYQLSMSRDIELSIYNLRGQKVATLVSERQPAGHYQVQWNAAGFASGIYICRLQAGRYTQSRKMILLQ
jgi:hypothetical protein